MDQIKSEDQTFYRTKRKCGDDTDAGGDDCLSAFEAGSVVEFLCFVATKNRVVGECEFDQPPLDFQIISSRSSALTAYAKITKSARFELD